MEIDDKLISYLETLSYISLTEAEKAHLITDLQSIIKNMSGLSALDTQGVSEISQPFSHVNSFREDDVVVQSFERSLILKNAKTKNNKNNKNNEMFVVPRAWN
ncbi:MAG: Asp-tRNA(Asn)/Glu-tRNA(Gln) amidotransferase subunit GatC [Defluviitaleaceae bacterium]|nr:Asp-tRNA(Asn)/Glu-tRNA(Gln) amidotransferase subunit GatC [Defluviitaleaceae bacterium]